MHDERPMKSPAHVGGIVRGIITEAGLSVAGAAAALGVTRPAVSALVNERASLSPEMALRIEKAFGMSMETLMQMQHNYDVAQARSREDEIAVSRYVPKDAATQAKLL